MNNPSHKVSRTNLKPNLEAELENQMGMTNTTFHSNQTRATTNMIVDLIGRDQFKKDCDLIKDGD